MSNFSSGTTDHEILRYHRILEAFKYGYAGKTYIGDPEFTNQSAVRTTLDRDPVS